MPSTSTIDSSLSPLTPTYPTRKPSLSNESPQSSALITHLNLQPHIEGGYFVETDRDTRRVPNPFSTSNNIQSPQSPRPSVSSQTRLTLLPSQCFQRRLHPRRQHHNPLPPHARLAAGSLPSQSRAHSTHSAQRAGAVRDHPRGRSRPRRPTRWLLLHIIGRKRQLRREEVMDRQSARRDFHRRPRRAGW
jgi:hypothetical protein